MFKTSFGQPPELKCHGSRKLDKLNFCAADMRKKQMCGSAMQAALRSPKNKPSKNYLRQNSLHIREKTKAVREQRVQQHEQCSASKDLFKLQRFKDVKSQVDVSKPSGWKPRDSNSLVGQSSDAAKGMESKNFIKMNSLNAKRAVPPVNTSVEMPSDPALARPRGVIPAYLQERKLISQAQQADSALPDGYKVVQEQEHKQILEGLRRKKIEVERDYKRLPLKIETLGQKQRQAKLEEQLQELTKAIATLSTPTLLVEAQPN